MKNQNIPNVYPVFIPPQNPKPKREYKPLTKKDNIFFALFFLSAFLLIDFGFKGFYLGFTIFYFVQFILTTLYLLDKNNVPSPFTCIIGGLSLVGATTFALFDNYWINVIMLVLVTGLYGLYSLGLSKIFKSKEGSYRIIIDLVLDAFYRTFASFGGVFGAVKASTKKNQKSIGAIVGIMVAVPFLCVIIPLLIKSDAAFEGLANMVLENVGTYILELIVALIIFPYFVSFAYGKSARLNDERKANAKNMKVLPASACVSFLSVIGVVYLVYMFSQLAYFFSAFSGILPEGYKLTASEFARRGFFEMFAICAINLGILTLVSILSKRNQKGKISLGIKLLGVFIACFNLALIASAMAKMKLNISIYGLTENRILVSVFMIMMVVVIAFFVLHLFVPRLPYMQGIVIICSVIFIALSFSNIDDKIASYNIKMFEESTSYSLDVETIANLSDASIPHLIALMASDNEEVSYSAKDAMYRIISFNFYDDLYYHDDEGLVLQREKDIRRFNLNHKKAIDSIERNFDFVSQCYEEMLEDCDYFG